MRPTFALDDAASPLMQAASLALALLRAAKVAAWCELVAEPDRLAGVHVSSEQLDLLNTHREALGWLQVGPPLVTVAVCPDCSRITIVTGTPATTCPMTLGCNGKPVRAAAAVRWKPPAQPDEEHADVPAVRADVADPHIYRS
jgi:hypothetical protein